MTTEDDFQGVLDANPKDWQTRLVFADWLQERGDPRAEGYRALGTLRLRPSPATHGPSIVLRGVDMQGRKIWTYCNPNNDESNREKSATLPEGWYSACEKNVISDTFWLRFPSRREAEDVAAIGFAKLSEKRRAALLAGPTKARKKPTRANPKKKPAKRKRKK